jgi:hypothetical protein
MMTEAESAAQEMPCPRCKKMHKKGPYVPRPELAKKPLGDVIPNSPSGQEVRYGTPIGPADVQCECGANLRHTVPIFCVDIYGWHWRIL